MTKENMKSIKSKLAAIALAASLSLGISNEQPFCKPLEYPIINEYKRQTKKREPHIDRGAITSPYRGKKVPRWKRKKQKKGKR